MSFKEYGKCKYCNKLCLLENLKGEVCLSCIAVINAYLDDVLNVTSDRSDIKVKHDKSLIDIE